MTFCNDLENILFTANPDEKIKQFYDFYQSYTNNTLFCEAQYSPKKVTQATYKSYCKIVPPSKVSTRKHLHTKDGKINLLHTIAHIEYSAIDLAIDATLRFFGLPKQYYKDWLEVAHDEIRHFEMIRKLLNELGADYGDQDAHTNLIEAMIKTDTLLERMAIVPRYLEANGLEQNPKIMKKLHSNPDNFNKKIIHALEVILEEEIDHVLKGDRWFRYECLKKGLDPESTYLQILEKYYPKATKRSRKLNFKARKKAGFSCDELKVLSNQSDCV